MNYCAAKSYDNAGFAVGEIFFGNDGMALAVDIFHRRLKIAKVRKQPDGFICDWNSHPDQYNAVTKDRRLFASDYKNIPTMGFYDRLQDAKEFYQANIFAICTGDNDRRTSSCDYKEVAK